MAFTLGSALTGAGALGSLLGGRSSQKASKEMLRRQAQGISLMNEQFRNAQPTYQSALQQYAQRSGLGQGYSPDAQGAEFGLGGRYGTREDQLRFAGAQDDIDRLARVRGNQLQNTMQRRGIATGSQAAALASNERAALADLARFRRGLAINAGQEQERRLGQLLGALNPALSMGQTGAALAGQQGQYYGNQAAQQFGNIGAIAQNWMQQQALRDYMQQYGVNPGQGTYGIYGETFGPTWAQYDQRAPTIGAPQMPLPTLTEEQLQQLRMLGFVG